MTAAPFFMFEIERYGDAARVQVFRVEWLETERVIVVDGEVVARSSHKRTRVADYETASRGATASARRELKKIQAAQ